MQHHGLSNAGDYRDQREGWGRKANVVANTAIALAQTGKRVLVLDADLGLGNIDILLGLTPKYTLEHVLAKSCRLEDIALTGPNGIWCYRPVPASRN